MQQSLILAKFRPDRFKLISDGQKEIGLHNIFTHNHASVDHESIHDTALQDVPKLKRECVETLSETVEAVNNGPEEKPGAF